MIFQQASLYQLNLTKIVSFYYYKFTMQEDKIKNYLHSLGMQDEFYSTSYTPRNYKIQRQKSQKNHEEKLSDWNNKRQFSLEVYSSLPKLTHEKVNQPQRVNSLDITEYHSSLFKDGLYRKKQQPVLVSPVVIKFNTNVAGNSLRRSQLMFHRILHNQSDKKGEDPKKLRQMLKKLRPQQQQSFGALSPPRTERCSGILRMLKRRQQIRIFKRRKENPDALRAIKLH